MMSVDQILGYSRAVLDSYGITTVITVMLIVAAAMFVYHRFFGDRD